MASPGSNRERGSSGAEQGSFVLKFINTVDIPPPEHKSKPSPYLRAYIAMQVVELGDDQEQHFHLKRISDIVCTPTKVDVHNVIWNSFRDFRIRPPSDSRLIVEIFHQTHDPAKPDNLLGKAEIALSRLDAEPLTVSLVTPPKIDRQKFPHFSVTLSRACINEEPPKRKVIFLIRHGESKWNEAQSKINITGMLDRDHALTELGIAQAGELNRRWRKEQDKISPPSPSTKGDMDDGIASQEAAASYATADLLGMDDDVGGESTAPSTTATLPSVPSFASRPLPPPPPAQNRAISRDIFSSIPGIDLLDEADEIQDINNIENLKNFDEDEEDLSDGESTDSDEDTRSALPSTKAVKGSGKATTVRISPNLLDFGTEHSVEIPIDDGSGGANKESGCCSLGTQEVGSYKSTLLLEEVHTACDMENDRAARMKRINDYKELFLQADKIYSSPLTRALETALVALEGHSVLSTEGLHLYSAIREVKNIGGLDTVGIETGDGIIKRARSELSQVMGNKRAQELVDIPVHINDAEQVWWTPMTAYDNDRDQQLRVREFISFMRYSGDTLPIFVGHSLFFKAFYSKRISKQLAKNRRQLSHDLQKFRLSNCSMLAVVVTFYDAPNGSSEAKLVDADLIFGGGFHGNPNYRNSLERKASLTLSEEKSLANAMAGTSPNNKFLGAESEDEHDGEGRNSNSEPSGGIFINRRRSGSSAPEREPRSSIVNGIEGFFSAFPSNFAAKKDALTKELTKGAKKFTDKVSEVSDKLHDIFEK